MKRRRGWALLEVTVSVSLMGVLLSIAGTLIVSLLRMDRQMQSDFSQQSSLSRLGVRLRSDVHVALDARCETETTCELRLSDDRRIHYELSDRAIRREVFHGDTLEHRDSYPLGSSTRAVFSLQRQGRSSLVRLTFTPGDMPPTKYDVSQRPAILEAAVNITGIPAAAPGGSP